MKTPEGNFWGEEVCDGQVVLTKQINGINIENGIEDCTNGKDSMSRNVRIEEMSLG